MGTPWASMENMASQPQVLPNEQKDKTKSIFHLFIQVSMG